MTHIQQILRDFKHYRQVTKPASKQRFKFYALIKRHINQTRKIHVRNLRIIIKMSLGNTYLNDDFNKSIHMIIHSMGAIKKN